MKIDLKNKLHIFIILMVSVACFMSVMIVLSPNDYFYSSSMDKSKNEVYWRVSMVYSWNSYNRCNLYLCGDCRTDRIINSKK